MLSVRGRLQCNLPSLLSFKLWAIFLASSSASLESFLHVLICCCLVGGVFCFRYSVTSSWIFLSISCSVLIRDE